MKELSAWLAGRKAWHYVEVKRNQVHTFVKRTKSGSVDVAQFGTVVKSGWGSDPDQHIMDQIDQRFRGRIEDMHTQRGDVTPLHMACFKEHDKIVKVLLQNGADPNEQDSFGLTPLHIAAMRGNIVIIKLLDEYKADSSILSNDRKTAIQVLNELKEKFSWAEHMYQVHRVTL